MVSATYDGFPAEVGASRLHVYDWPTVDGRPGGGTPHLHLTCSEGYVVTAGGGTVQTLTTSGYQETPLEPGTVAWCTPGTIHRLINDGGLEITVVMQNSGLPADTETYAEAVRIPADVAEARKEEIPRDRRDLATRRFLELREATERGDPEPLSAFQQAAAELTRHRLDGWRERWHEGAHSATRATESPLDALGAQNTHHLSEARVSATGPTARGRFGMCGRLDVYPRI